MSDPRPGAVLRGAVDLSALRSRAAAPASPTGHAPASGSPSLVFDVTDATFGQVLELSRTVPVVVDLWAEWCGPCKQIAPSLEALAEELGEKMTIAKLNIDENPMTPSKYGVRGIPTLMLFKDGQVAATRIGAMPKGKLMEWIQSVL